MDTDKIKIYGSRVRVDMSIEHADFDGIERLAAVTGGEIASTFDRPNLVSLGECALIDEIVVGEDKLFRFSGCKSGNACSIILRGASSHLLDEAERSLHDALCVLTETVKETRVVCGGGCMEMLMVDAIDKQIPTTAGKAALAMEAFSRAFNRSICHSFCCAFDCSFSGAFCVSV